MTELNATKKDELLPIWRIVKMPESSPYPQVEPILPIGRSTFLFGVKRGLYPKPVRMSTRKVFWKSSEIHALLSNGVANKGAEA
jgi:prophage regulatory protein